MSRSTPGDGSPSVLAQQTVGTGKPLDRPETRATVPESTHTDLEPPSHGPRHSDERATRTGLQPDALQQGCADGDAVSVLRQRTDGLETRLDEL